MFTPKALIDFSKNADSNLDVDCKNIYQKMNGNINYPNPIPSMDVIGKLVSNYSDALVAAKSRDKLLVAEKKQSRIDLEAGMGQLGNYVNTVSKGNLPMLASTGFPISKPPVPRIIFAPIIASIEQGINPGVLIVKISSVLTANSYQYFIAPDPLTKDTKWDSVSSGRTQHTFENLEQGKKYWFKVAAIGSYLQIAYSDEVSQYVMQKTTV
jgi:hypothetical protein